MPEDKEAERKEPMGMDTEPKKERKMPVDKLVDETREPLKENLGLGSAPLTSGPFTPERPLAAKQLIYIWDISNLVYVGLDGQDKGDLKRKQDSKPAKDKDSFPYIDKATGFQDWTIDFSGNWIIDAVTGAQAPGIQLMDYYYDNYISPIKVMLVEPGNADIQRIGNMIITEWDLMGPVDGVVTYSGNLDGKMGYTTANLF